MPSAEIAYIDESYDQTTFAMSALIVPTHAWRDAFLRLQAYRKHLKSTAFLPVPSSMQPNL
jgi:hypothetical protein